MQILYIPNDCSTTGHLPFLFWGDVRATTKKLSPRMQDARVRRLLWLFLRIPGVAHIVRPQLLAGNCQ